jgi:hypothetical protein
MQGLRRLRRYLAPDRKLRKHNATTGEGDMKHSLAAIVIAAGLAACASEPKPPPTLSEEAFKPMLAGILATNKMAEWEKVAKDLLARTDLSDTQRADIYFARRINRGVWVETRTVATPQCAVADIDRALALVPTGQKADAARKDRLYQESRYIYFESPGNCD